MSETSVEPAARVIAALSERGHTLSVAESCTGGLIGAQLTAVAGASEVFWGGVISYDDAAKRGLLGVSAETLAAHGAVSAETAAAMARGVRERSGTTWSIAVTGIAGPGGGSEEKPVGTVWLAMSGLHGGERRCRFDGDREAVRQATARTALEWLEETVRTTTSSVE
ncbi:MAG: nicotinamide-nucleotide amidohydrolase family protein [Gemmatimonadetes bacterium]|nr:nicotinamide-nucleotide amidohydrolase family protein [Gemmatimonadota bacterium]